MADGLYILTLCLTQNITKLMDERETNMMKKAALVVCLFYGPWFLKSYVVEKSPNNDLESFKQAFALQKVYPDLGRALLASLQRHSWYLTEQLVVTALADDDVEESVKVQMMENLLSNPTPETFRIEKPELKVIYQSTTLPDLIGPESWNLLKVAGVDESEVTKWKSHQNSS